MDAVPEPSVYEVLGLHVHNVQEETSSVNGWEDLREQVASTFCQCDCQASRLGIATAKRCLGSTRSSGAEICGKVKTRGLQSGRGSSGKCLMGARVKEEDITQNIKAKTGHVSSMVGLEDMEIPRSSHDGKHPPEDIIIIEDDSDDEENENGYDSVLNTENLSNDCEDDDHDLTSESDAHSTKNRRSISCQATGQMFNCNRQRIPKLSNHSEDEDNCQISWPGRFTPFRSMKSVYRQRSSMKNPADHDRYVCESLSSDSDCADCEIIMEGSYGKICEQWEQAALRKQVSHGMKYKRHLGEEEFSGSGSNFCPNTPFREFQREARNEHLDANFQEHHFDRYSTDPPDLVSASGIVYTSSQDDVTSHRTPKEPETQSPSVETSNGASVSQSINTVEVQPSRERNKCGQNSHGIKMREVRLDLPHPKSQKVTNKILTSFAETKSEFAAVENSSEWVADREKLKKTAAFRYAEQEEWAQRQNELQRQAEEAHRQRKIIRAEATRKLEMERRQKQRLEEMRETQKKDEEIMDLKEKLCVQIRAQLEQVASKSKDLASLLRNLGIPVEGGASPSSQQVNAAFKQALLRFHPDHASNRGLDYQVGAEETFKLILCLKNKLLPVVPTYLNRTS